MSHYRKINWETKPDFQQEGERPTPNDNKIFSRKPYHTATLLPIFSGLVQCVIIIIPATFAVLPLITFLFWLCIIALLLPKSSLEF